MVLWIDSMVAVEIIHGCSTNSLETIQRKRKCKDGIEMMINQHFIYNNLKNAYWSIWLFSDTYVCCPYTNHCHNLFDISST